MADNSMDSRNSQYSVEIRQTKGGGKYIAVTESGIARKQAHSEQPSAKTIDELRQALEEASMAMQP